MTDDGSVGDSRPPNADSSADASQEDARQGEGICREYEAPEVTGEITNSEVTECSGLASSHDNPGVYWLHNDSGDTPRLFAVNGRGTTLAELTVENATHEDWEDLSIITRAGTDRLVIGDIGDNPMMRPSITLYLIDEPALTPESDEPQMLDAIAETIRLTYPDGASYNAESLAVDPVSGHLYLLTKDDRGMSRLFVHRGPFTPSSEPHTVEEVARIQINAEGAISTHATGMDISPSGDRVLVRTYFELIQWIRPSGTSVEDAVNSPRTVLASPPERQGEAVCFTADGAAFLTISEGSLPAVYRSETAPSCEPSPSGSNP